ncbi:methyltransferase-like protein 27 [Tubulanus polymorphus]|uniref:methyltransferase-like protein 27 n=1 Tax=Tubulanus polymorphus TaxID=672921 RepID=UPI003DA59000
MAELLSNKLDDFMNETHVLPKHDIINMYNQWTTTYEKEVGENYEAPNRLAESVCRHVHNKKASFLDVGAGTGLFAEALLKAGFNGHFDGLDPATGFAAKAKERKLYYNFYHEFITEEPCSIPTETYDNIAVCGAIVPGHIHYNAIVELLRMIKKGGHIFIAMREEYTKTKFSGMDEFLADLENAGKCKVVERSTYTNHYIHYNGLLLVIQKY